jgi:HK97 family phage portal protein
MLALQSDGTVNGTRLADTRAIAGEDYLWQPMGSTAGMPVTERTALGLSSVLAVFIVLATDSAVLPLHVFKRREDGGRDPDTKHPNERLVSVSPDDETTPIRWRQALMFHALQHGNGYAEIQRKGRGTPAALHLLDPETTRPIRRGGRLWYEIDNGAGSIPKENVLHIAGIGFDGLTGYNLIRMLSQPIGLTMAAETSAAQFFANGAQPGGIIETPNSLKTQDARNNLLNSWNAEGQGPHNRHKTRILEQGAKWVATETDPEKQQLVETRKFQAIDTTRPWRVPPHKLGDYSQSHLANIEASNLDYLMTALVPWLEVIEQEFNLKLFSEAERAQGYFFEHNVNGLLRGDVAGRGKFYQILRDLGVLTPNLISKMENMNPIGPEGDIRLVPLNMVPLDQAGIVASANAAPAKKPAPAPASPPAAPAEPTPGDGTDTPLTGEQIFSIQRVLSDVVVGDLPAGTAKALLKASLPSLDDAEIDAMLAPIADFNATGPKSRP